VVTTYDGQAMLAACLDALLAQTHPPAEVLVVDDASPADDAAWVRARYPGVRTLRLERNLGHAGAAAAGIAGTRGELVALVNNDAVPDPDWCAEARRPFADPQVGSVATRLVLADDPRRLDSAGDAYTVVGSAYKRLDGEPDPAETEPRSVFSACAAAAVYRRAALQSCGGVDPELVAYYDDVDLGFRLRLAGFSCVYAPAARCRHRLSASYGRGSWRQLFLTSRNAARVFWSDMPGALLLRHLPAHALFLALQSGSALLHGGFLPLVAGKAAAAWGLPGTLRRRRRVQATSRVTPAAIASALDPGWLRHHLAELVRHHRRRRSLRTSPAAIGRGA
jgi:GT2 family glycosyltransferase